MSTILSDERPNELEAAAVPLLNLWAQATGRPVTDAQHVALVGLLAAVMNALVSA